MCLGGEEATDCYCSEVLRRREKVNELNAELPGRLSSWDSFLYTDSLMCLTSMVARRCKTQQHWMKYIRKIESTTFSTFFRFFTTLITAWKLTFLSLPSSHGYKTTQKQRTVLTPCDPVFTLTLYCCYLFTLKYGKQVHIYITCSFECHMHIVLYS